MKRIGLVILASLPILCSCGSNQDFSPVGGGNPPLVTVKGVAAGADLVAVGAGSNRVVARATSTGGSEPLNLILSPGNYRFFVVENSNSASQRSFLLMQGNTSVLASARTVRSTSIWANWIPGRGLLSLRTTRSATQG